MTGNDKIKSVVYRFKYAVFDFFKNCSTQYKNELESLMTEKFHIIES